VIRTLRLYSLVKSLSFNSSSQEERFFALLIYESFVKSGYSRIGIY